jgi:hypothetical protein
MSQIQAEMHEPRQVIYEEDIRTRYPCDGVRIDGVQSHRAEGSASEHRADNSASDRCA